MSRRHHVAPRTDNRAPLVPRQLADLLTEDGQLLLPRLDLIERVVAAINELINPIGRAMTGAAAWRGRRGPGPAYIP